MEAIDSMIIQLNKILAKKVKGKLRICTWTQKILSVSLVIKMHVFYALLTWSR